MSVKTSEIKIQVELDENKLPENIYWQATDSGTDGKTPCRSMLLSMWDHVDESTLRIDLWTKDMTVDDMKKFFYETFVTMADTYERACMDDENAKRIRTFAKEFGQHAEVTKKS